MAGKSLQELRKLDRAQILGLRLTKDDLITAILATPDVPEQTQLNNADVLTLIDEIRGLKDAFQKNADEVRGLKETMRTNEANYNTKLDELTNRITKQDEIIKNQQIAFEKIDAEKRENKLVVLGVPDEQESLDGATDDKTKLAKVWESIGESCVVQAHQRLGRQEAGRSRPILVTVARREERDAVIGRAKQLKNDVREPFKKVFIKKDTHPAVRREWGRLWNVVRVEKARPENLHVDIRLDPRERKVYRGDVEIASWNASNF